jgi:hypothetical protein
MTRVDRCLTRMLALMWLVATTVAAAPGDSTTPIRDPGWPRSYTTAEGTRLQVYQPQVASWDDRRHLTAYVAVAHQARTAAKPTLGTLKVEADTTVALEQRLVNFSAFTITEANFGATSREDTRRIISDVEQAMPALERVIALDRVLASMDASQIRPKNIDGVKADPPTIFFSTRPAVLVNFDGAPIWSPIEGSDLKFAINTNWDVFEHAATNTLYLRHDETWLKATTLSGPWVPVGVLPASFGALPADANWRDVRMSLPYARGAVAYGPYGGAGAAARYNPATGTYARGATAWGPYGATGVAQAYNPRTGVYSQTRQASGVYGSWGSSYVQRGDDWAQSARATNNVTGNTARVTRTDDGAAVSRTGPGGSGFVAAGEEGVYAGRDGNVYRRADGGGWQKYEDGSWGATQRPQESSTLGQLERDRSARLDGTQRTRPQSPSGSARANAGSGRPSGRSGGRGR